MVSTYTHSRSAIAQITASGGLCSVNTLIVLYALTRYLESICSEMTPSEFAEARRHGLDLYRLIEEPTAGGIV